MRSPLRLPGVLPLLAVGFVFTGAITATELAAVRASHDEGAPAAAGWLIAALSLGSIIGGLAYGARRPPGGDRRHIAVCLALWITGHLLCALAPSLALIGVLLAVAGIGLAPAITAQYALIAALTPDRARTEGFAWLNAAGQAGAATAAALTGLLAGPGPFLLSAALALVGISLLPRTSIRA
jgi:MFS family permease